MREMLEFSAQLLSLAHRDRNLSKDPDFPHIYVSIQVQSKCNQANIRDWHQIGQMLDLIFFLKIT